MFADRIRWNKIVGNSEEKIIMADYEGVAMPESLQMCVNL